MTTTIRHNLEKVAVARTKVTSNGSGRLPCAVSPSRLSDRIIANRPHFLPSPCRGAFRIIAPALLVTVSVVLGFSAQKQMLRINTGPIIAAGTIVQNTKGVRDWTKVEDVRKPVRINPKPALLGQWGYIKQPVAIGFLTVPQPAGIRLFNEAQKSVSYRQVRAVPKTLRALGRATTRTFLSAKELLTAEFADEGSSESCHNNLLYRSVVVRIGGRFRRSPFRILAQLEAA